MDNAEWAEWWLTNWISRNLSYVANGWSLREFQFKLARSWKFVALTQIDIWMKVEESHSVWLNSVGRGKGENRQRQALCKFDQKLGRVVEWQMLLGKEKAGRQANEDGDWTKSCRKITWTLLAERLEMEFFPPPRKYRFQNLSLLNHTGPHLNCREMKKNERRTGKSWSQPGEERQGKEKRDTDKESGWGIWKTERI